MTTTHKQDEFKPRLLVPVGESILVHYSGKPPKPSTRQYQGRPITEVTFWLGIADKNYPDLVGQYHPAIFRSWIAPGKPGNPNATPPVPPIQPSKLYKAIQAMGGEEATEYFQYHDAALNAADPNLDDSQRQKALSEEDWRQLRGFYIAVFKDPRRDKETKEIIRAENGGIFWQEIAELRPLKFGRIFNEEQLQASIIWPPPKPEPKPLGLPHAAQAKPQDPAPPEGPPPEAKDAAPARQSEPEPKTDEQVLAELAKLYQSSDEYRAVIMAVLRDNNVTKGAALKPEERRRLYAICLCVKEWVQAPDLKAKGQALLQQVNTPIHKLTAEQATNLQRDLVAPF